MSPFTPMYTVNTFRVEHKDMFLVKRLNPQRRTEEPEKTWPAAPVSADTSVPIVHLPNQEQKQGVASRHPRPLL